MSKKKNYKRLAIVGQCRDCRALYNLPRRAFFRAASARCLQCGGIIDPTRPILYKRTMPPMKGY